MKVSYLILGIIMGILCLGISLSLPTFFTSMSDNTMGIIQIALLMLGMACFIMGAIDE